MMKDTHFLYSIATLAIGSILAIFVGLATGTLPTSTPREASAALATRTSEKKDCNCCSKVSAENLAASQERIVPLKTQRLAYQKASELIQQYGLEEGLRRIKEFAPEIAEHLEHFTEKDTVAQEN